MPVCPECGTKSETLGGQCSIDGSHFIREEAIAKRREEPLLGFCFGGTFALVDLLGKGNMGSVYEAYHQRLERRVAIKVLRRDVKGQPSARKRFRREARTIAMLDHPNIVSIYDFDVEGGYSYIAMEFVEAYTLSDYQPYDTLPMAGALLMLRQILAALADAHEQDVVHRDLKPDNISVTHKVGHPYYVKVLDFGLAKLVDQSASDQTMLTEHGEVLGTPLYMSPEQAMAEEIDHRTDLYAWGVMAYEMVTGSVPFNAPSALATMMQHVHKEVPPIQPRAGVSVGNELQQVIMRCLEKKPDDRFASAHKALVAFESTPEVRRLRPHSYDVELF